MKADINLKNAIAVFTVLPGLLTERYNWYPNFVSLKRGNQSDFYRSFECVISSINFNCTSFTKWCITSSFGFNNGFSINLHMVKHDKLLNISWNMAVLIST